MPRSCYAIEQHQGHWVVSVCGARGLTCKTKRTALKTARRAMELLHQSQQVEILHGDVSCRGGTDRRQDRHDGDAPAKAAAARRG
jgi:hypothetical protein